MKAMVLQGVQDIKYQEIPTPACPDDGLLLRIDAVGLCGSDVRAYMTGSSSLRYPVVLGHEFVGTVAEVGRAVEGEWSVGDMLTANPTVSCYQCFYCMHNMSDICENLEIAGNTFPGAFAQYMAIPGFALQRGQLIKLPKDTVKEPFILTELLASVLKAQEDIDVGLGETVVVIGSGPIGCLHTQVARLRGASKIILADINGDRLEKCRDFGAHHFVVSSREDLVQRVMEITDGHGADAVIAACPSAQPYQQALEMLRKEGRLSIFGGLPAGESTAALDANLIHYKRLRIFGSFTYSVKEFQLGFDLVREGRINAGIITDIIPLKDMVRGVNLVRSGAALKVVMRPWDEGECLDGE